MTSEEFRAQMAKVTAQIEASNELIARLLGKPKSYSTTHLNPPQSKATQKLSAEAQWIRDNER